MPKEIKKENRSLYQCNECLLIYPNLELANQCEAWCKENHSCNLGIISKAIDN